MLVCSQGHSQTWGICLWFTHHPCLFGEAGFQAHMCPSKREGGGSGCSSMETRLGAVPHHSQWRTNLSGGHVWQVEEAEKGSHELRTLIFVT